MTTGAPIQSLAVLVVLGLLTGILGHIPLNEAHRSGSWDLCTHVCPGATSCINTTNGEQFVYRCVYPNGQLDIMRDKNVMSKRMQLQSARQESPNVPTAQPDLMEKTDVRPSNASRLRQLIRKALDETLGRLPKKTNVIPVDAFPAVNFSRRLSPDRNRVTLQPAVPITTPSTPFLELSANPQCEYCESPDQCKDKTRPYCYHSHACARRVCQSL
ncbi:uncharacterized protein LOC127834529 [Dreissena polymorpha]|uniref:Uncharacterized protein n=1 Tax=Dreissena polymorpha TaxID=45954 RepID=A0A9D4GDJ1_DREPO|nr:uncharacterized protein LOC127834529 [Dreissena polymorpha]KAH3813418.1 hypothetical protein DPMN_141874 [Dreissena polymorpha]